MTTMEPLYTTSVTSTGGRRDGRVRSAQGTLDLAVDPPGHGDGTNPEELFAAGYAACFTSAAALAARRLKLDPSGLEVTAEVTLGRVGDDYDIAVHLRLTAPKIPQEDAERVIDIAHQGCPYSRATRGNIEVGLTANGGA